MEKIIARFVPLVMISLGQAPAVPPLFEMIEISFILDSVFMTVHEEEDGVENQDNNRFSDHKATARFISQARQ